MSNYADNKIRLTLIHRDGTVLEQYVKHEGPPSDADITSLDNEGNPMEPGFWYTSGRTLIGDDVNLMYDIGEDVNIMDDIQLSISKRSIP